MGAFDEATIKEAVQAILGDSPKSSLLFGAPAISIRQIESNLGLPAGNLSASDVLHPASQVAQSTFKGKKQAQVKNLRRSGETEEWIVFRPNLPGSSLPAIPSREIIVKRPVPVISPSRTSDLEQRPHFRPGGEVIRDISLLPPPSKQEISTKRSFLRPFFKSTISYENKLPPAARAELEQEIEVPALPPPHRMGSSDFGHALLVPLAVEAVPSGVKAYQPNLGPKMQQEPVYNPAKQLPAESKRTSDSSAADQSSDRPPLQTYVPVDIDKQHIPLRVESKEDSPLRPRPRFAPIPPRRISSTSEDQIKPESDSSLPYLGRTSRKHIEATPKQSEIPSRIQDDPTEFIPRNLDKPDKPIPNPFSLIISLSPTSSTPNTPHTPRPLSTLNTLLSPLSPLLLSPISPISPLTPSSSSDPNLSLSPTFDRPPTPWLSVAFADLPFGPDVPAFQIFGWARDRWQLLCAEMVVVLGAVYIIQILGI